MALGRRTIASFGWSALYGRREVIMRLLAIGAKVIGWDVGFHCS